MIINYLVKEHIYEMHQQAIYEQGGSDGIFNNTDSKIESILSQQEGYFGYEKYPDVFSKSAMLVYFFVKNHCFPDGNKRVALYSLYVFLQLNDYELICSNDEIEDLIIEIASSNYRSYAIDTYIFKIADFIKENCIYITD